MRSNKTNCLLVQANAKCHEKLIELSDYCSLANAIGCEYVQSVIRWFGNEPYLIVCDEEGKLKSNQKPTIVTCDENGSMVEYFVGDCVILRNGYKSLRACDVKRINESSIIVNKQDGKPLRVLRCSLQSFML